MNTNKTAPNFLSNPSKMPCASLNIPAWRYCPAAKIMMNLAKKAKKALVGNILEKEVLVGSLKEDNKQSRFEELFEWEENKLSVFEEALANIPAPETEKTFGKGKVQEEEATPREEPEKERMFAMKDGKIKFNPKAYKGD